jgi:hypothetical protein
MREVLRQMVARTSCGRLAPLPVEAQGVGVFARSQRFGGG